MRNWVYSISISLALVTGAALMPSGAQNLGALVIQGGTLVDGNGGPPVTNSVIVIRENRIAQIGRVGQVQIPAGAQVINANGKWIVPGLIDAKANYAANFGEAFPIWGVTSIVWSGGGGDAGTAERDAINRGLIRGPRMFLSFAAIAGPGPDGKKPDTGVPGRYQYVARSVEEARKLSQDFLSAGADFLSAADGDGPPELFAAIVDEAHKAGKSAVMRAVGPATRARASALMNADVLIHTGNAGNEIARDPEKWKDYVGLPPDPYSDMDDAKAAELIKLLVEHKTALEPDLMATGRGFPKNWARVQEEDANFFKDRALLSYYPRLQIANLLENVKSANTYLQGPALEIRARAFRNHVTFLKRFVDAGGRVVPASDITQTPPGLGLHQELAVFEEDIGMTPMQVIQSATKWNAEAFKLQDLGVIEVGKLADIVIVNDDPTRTVINLRKIDTVIKDGKIFDRSYHADHLDSTFRSGLLADGNCCFSTPVIEGAAWAAAAKQATFRPGVGYRNERILPGTLWDPEAALPPGIESIMPYVLRQGTPTTIMTIKGFGYVRGSQVYVDNVPIPTKVISQTEIQATLDQNLLARAGRFRIHVANPEPASQPDWGVKSNIANLVVHYPFTNMTSQNKF